MLRQTKMKKIILFVLLFIPLFTAIAADTTGLDKQIEVGIDDKRCLGKNIPLDLKFKDSDGNEVLLKNVIKKPTIFTLVYFDCPGICTPLLEGLIEVLNQKTMDFTAGKEFDIITVSFDHKETPEIAKRWKDKHLKDLTSPVSSEGWRFLVGDSVTVRKLTDAFGFRFKKDGERDYLHGAALIAVSPKGQIIRYIYGTSFLPFDIKMATAEANRGEPGPTVAKILDLCFKYDPAGRKYVLNLTRIVGTVMLLTIGLFATYLYRSGKKKDKENDLKVVNEEENKEI